MTIQHLDGDPRNNDLANLRIVETPDVLVCDFCDMQITDDNYATCPQLGDVHPACHTYANGCRGELCDPGYEGN